MIFETSTYRLSRTELARLTSIEYLRTFWWVVIGIPLFGLVATSFGQGILQVIGYFALIWPFSIPARSVLTTTNASRLFCGGLKVVAFEDRLEFRGEKSGKSGKPYRMVVPFANLRDVVIRKDYAFVRTLRLGVAPVPISAFPSPENIEFLRSMSIVRA